jgi:hypothetical protein
MSGDGPGNSAGLLEMPLLHEEQPLDTGEPLITVPHDEVPHDE